MRLIGKLPDINQGKEFSAFLKKEKIENEYEFEINSEGTQSAILIWIIDEDQVEEAAQWYDLFLKNPTDKRFYGHKIPSGVLTGAEIPPSASFSNTSVKLPKNKQRSKGFITILLLFVCIAVYIWEQATMPTIPKTKENAFLPSITLLSDAQKKLLYDYPYYYELATQIFRLYSIDQIQDPANRPPELNELLNHLKETNYWQGAYQEFLAHYKDPSKVAYNGPMFEKIQEGQLWRLISPIVLHADIFHIFFNVIWLIILGNQIEKRIGSGKYLMLILSAAIISNTAQYLMAGPNFLGLSGVVCAMAGFIWSRQKKAPWEGYLIQRSTMIFIAIFVIAMFSLQIISFAIELFNGPSFSPGIANTAHLAGGAVGLLMGRMKFFAWKTRH